MEMKDIELNKQKFIDIAKTNIKRDGINELLAWLETTDFFTCPASAKFHSAEPGGLCFHSLNVYKRLLKLAKDEFGEENVNLESVSIIALFHDICKCCFYKQEMRNVKENGEWVQKPYYVIDDQLPYGHGEKSVYIISGFMKLTRDEAFAIRYHMGFSGPEDANQVGKALEMFPLAFSLCVADMEASYYMEGNPNWNLRR